MKNETTRSLKYIEHNTDMINTSMVTEQNETEEQIENYQEHSKFKKFLIYLALFIILIVIYVTTLGTSLVNVNEYKVESNILLSSFHGLKIVHFSDIHYGTKINKKQLEKIITQINNLNPDLIFFTGDLIDKNISPTEESIKEITDSLKNLTPKLYKYAIYGDEDINNSKYEEIITNAEFILLNNETKLLYYEDNTPISITGFNIIDKKPNYTILTNTIDEIDQTNLYKIVLAHEPDSLDNFINYNPNLVLSGHSLGGLIKLPLLKPLFLPNNSKNYYENHYSINNTEMFISNGLGTSGINARLNNNPSINLYRLYQTK